MNKEVIGGGTNAVKLVRVTPDPDKLRFKPVINLFPGVGADAEVFDELQVKFWKRGFATEAVTTLFPGEVGASIKKMQSRMVGATAMHGKPFVSLGYSAGAIGSLDIACNRPWGNMRAAIGINCSAYAGQKLGWKAQTSLLFGHWKDLLLNRDIVLSEREALELFYTGVERSRALKAFAQLKPLSIDVLNELGKKIVFPKEKVKFHCLIVSTEEDVVNPSSKQDEIVQRLGADLRINGGPHVIPSANEDDLVHLVMQIEGWLKQRLPKEFVK